MEWVFKYTNWFYDKIRSEKGPDCTKVFKEFAKRTNFNGIATVSFDTPMLLVVDQEAVKDFYTTKYMFFEKHPIFQKFTSPIIGKNNLVASFHKEWKKARTIISKSFTYNRIKSSLPRVLQVTKDNFIREEKLNGKIDVLNFFQNITGESFMMSFIGEELMNKEINGLSISNELAFLFGQMALSINKRNKILLILDLMFNINIENRSEHKKILKRIENFKSIIKHSIQIKRESFEKNGADDTLISEMFEGNQFTDDEIVNQTISLFFAGIDTTGHLLGSIMYVFGHHPEFQTQMINEFREKMKCNSDITIDNLKDENLPFVNAIIQETLRLYNPAIGLFMRQCIKDTTLGKFNIEKGTILYMSPYISTQNPQYFENPEIYDPSRWINNEKQEEILKKNPFAFIPFSAGNRNCIGQHFARLEAKAILAYMCLNYDFKVEKSNSRWISRFLYEPEDPIHLEIKKRIL